VDAPFGPTPKEPFFLFFLSGGIPGNFKERWNPQNLGRNPFAFIIRYRLVQDEETIEGNENLKSYITNYYKYLFGSPEEGNFSMNETRIDDIPQVSMEENGLLTAPYSEDEVKKVVFQMEHNKAPGPDGFPAEFYQNFQEVIKLDLLELFCTLDNLSCFV
jgi:hypothetical protein